ncbi:hypothetical protein SDC9_205917 [bioreactor metagenome]|uniref:Uncharacterized protein n=1 Tax=bioreactor metagenome TaxID=1076179 RepID=A0A645JCT0_9ZZZZ
MQTAVGNALAVDFFVGFCLRYFGLDVDVILFRETSFFVQFIKSSERILALL